MNTNTLPLAAEIDRLRAENKKMRDALNKIASWSEGAIVDKSFDEPGSAKIARDALAKARQA